MQIHLLLHLVLSRSCGSLGSTYSVCNLEYESELVYFTIYYHGMVIVNSTAMCAVLYVLVVNYAFILPISVHCSITTSLPNLTKSPPARGGSPDPPSRQLSEVEVNTVLLLDQTTFDSKLDGLLFH